MSLLLLLDDGPSFQRSLFASGEQGIWLDPSDFSTLFQDSAGTTPVTAVGQPVGLALDKRLGLVVGSEVVTNGSFTSGTTGWVNNGGLATTFESVAHDGEATALHVIGPLSSGANRPALTANKVYSVTYKVKVISGSMYVGIGSNAVGGIHTTADAGTWKTVTRAIYGATDGSVRLYTNSTGTEFYITGVSFKELPGNHAYQTTSASRPTVEARVNLLLNSGLTGGGAAPTGWSQIIANGTSAPVTSMYGNADGAVAYLQTGTAARPVFFSGNIAVSANTTYTYSILIESVSGSLVANTCATISNPPSGVTITYPVCSANPSGAASGVLTTGTLEVSIAVAATAGIVQLRCGLGSSGAATGTVQFSRPQFEEGTSRTTYQRVNTATDYVDVGAPRYLQLDGTDDGMATPSINFTGTDKMTVWAGVRKLSDAAAGIICELSADRTANNGAFSLVSSGAPSFLFASKGTLDSTNTVTGNASPISRVLTGIGDIAGDKADLRVNGSATPATTDQGTGNYGNYPLYIGRRGGTSSPFNGRIYQLIVRGAASNAGQIAATEAYVNAKTRAY